MKGAEGGEERGGEQETTTRGECEVKRRVTKRSGSSIQTNNACFRRDAFVFHPRLLLSTVALLSL